MNKIQFLKSTILCLGLTLALNSLYAMRGEVTNNLQQRHNLSFEKTTWHTQIDYNKPIRSAQMPDESIHCQYQNGMKIITSPDKTINTVFLPNGVIRIITLGNPAVLVIYPDGKREEQILNPDFFMRTRQIN